MTLHELAELVVKACREHSPASPYQHRKTETSAIMTLFRPYVEKAITGYSPKTLRDDSDMRQKKWLLSMEWIDMRTGQVIAMSEGRAYRGTTMKDREMISVGGDIVTGLEEGAKVIAEYAAAIDAPMPDFSYETMRKALSFLRPTLSRERGFATMRRISEDKGIWLVCDIWREDVFPKQEDIDKLLYGPTQS
jgi:hypothetical protein